MTGVGRRWWLPVVFLAPLVLVLVSLRVVPVFVGVVLSLFKWDGFSDPRFVGLRNFEALTRDPNFKTAMGNLVAVVLAVPLWVLLPLLLAVAIHQRIPGWRAFRIALFVPAVLAPVAIGIAFDILLRPDGPANTSLRTLGLGGLTRSWLVDPTTALPVVILILVWAGIGVGVAIFVSALAQVDPDLPDAARVDGASWVQTFRHITVPQLQPVIEFWAVIIVISVMTGIFPYVFTLTGGGPGYASTVPEFFIYQSAFKVGDFGKASAVGVVLFGIVSVVVVVQLLLFRRGMAR